MDIIGGMPILVNKIRSIRDQTAASNVQAFVVDRGQSVAGRKPDDQIALNVRQRAPCHDQTAITRTRECRDRALGLAGVAQVSGLTSTPTDRATDWMTANWPIPVIAVGSRRTTARVTPGTISLSSSSHFAHRS